MTDLKLKYNETQKNTSPPNSEEISSNEVGLEVRNICFGLLSGTVIFLNYSYLISGELSVDINDIELVFTTHKVKIKGIKLDNLFYEIMNRSSKFIIARDKRYAQLEETKTFVMDVIIEKNQS